MPLSSRFGAGGAIRTGHRAALTIVMPDRPRFRGAEGIGEFLP
jgi:hypothetical protein